MDEWVLCGSLRGSTVPLGRPQEDWEKTMATTTAAPATTTQETEKKAPLILTPQAIAKVREIMATQDPLPAGLRIGVVGGGCSGFQYSMAFENQAGVMDKGFKFDDLSVYVDAKSLMYLNASIPSSLKPLKP